MKTFNIISSHLQTGFNHFKQTAHSTTWNDRLIHLLKGSGYFFIPLVGFTALVAVIRLGISLSSAQQSSSRSARAPEWEVEKRSLSEQARNQLQAKVQKVQQELVWVEPEDSPEWAKRDQTIYIKISSVQVALTEAWRDTRNEFPWKQAIVKEKLFADLTKIEGMKKSFNQLDDKGKGSQVYVQYTELKKIINRILQILKTSP